jgi:hypothetical protein
VEDVRKTFRDRTGFELDEEQVLLVGSNPLPVVVAALALRPERGVHLVYTAEVKPRTERIAEMLKAKGVQVRSLVLLNEPRSGARIREALAAQFGHVDWTKVGLHYTGGTKPMVAAVHAHWSALRKCAAQASYLGDDAKLRFESERSPTEISLRDDPQMTLAELTQLHAGITPERSDEHEKQSHADLARKIHAFVRESSCFDDYRRLLPPIYGSRQDIFVSLIPKKDAEARKLETLQFRIDDMRKAESFDLTSERNFRSEAFGGPHYSALCEALGVPGATLDDVGDLLHQGSRPSKAEDLRERRLSDTKWLWGKWFEVWLAGVLQTARDDKDDPLFHEVHQNVELKRDGKPFFEADVVAVRGHRAFLFSCTVDATRSLVKSKLFEAGQRTAQLGGDHARFAVVSFHRDPDKIRKELEEDGWAGYDTARSFGEADLASADVLLAKIRLWVLG